MYFCLRHHGSLGWGILWMHANSLNMGDSFCNARSENHCERVNFEEIRK